MHQKSFCINFLSRLKYVGIINYYYYYTSFFYLPMKMWFRYNYVFGANIWSEILLPFVIVLLWPMVRVVIALQIADILAIDTGSRKHLIGFSNPLIRHCKKDQAIRVKLHWETKKNGDRVPSLGWKWTNSIIGLLPLV